MMTHDRKTISFARRGRWLAGLAPRMVVADFITK